MSQQDRILKAVALAVAAHDGQRRKGTGAPYVLHPLRVAATVAAATPPGDGRDDCILAAICHDMIEDTKVGREQIEREFGAKVASLVAELTQDKSLPKDSRRRLMIEHCKEMSPEAKRIKLADRLDNLRESDGLGGDFLRRYCAETKEMLERLREACPPIEADLRKVLQERLAALKEG